MTTPEIWRQQRLANAATELEFTKSLAPLVGGEYIEKPARDWHDSPHARIDIGEFLSLRISSEKGNSWRCYLFFNHAIGREFSDTGWQLPTLLPSETNASKDKPIAQIARQITAKLITPAAPMIAAAIEKRESLRNSRASLASIVADLRERFPAVDIKMESGDTGATLRIYQSRESDYVQISARLGSEGQLHLDRGTVRSASRAAAVIAAMLS